MSDLGASHLKTHEIQQRKLSRNSNGHNFSLGCPVATYPSAGGWLETRGMRVPRKEYARSRHQRLFEENVEKTGKDAIYELLVEGSGVVFMHGEGISTPHVRPKGRQPLIECANMTLIFYVPF